MKKMLMGLLASVGLFACMGIASAQTVTYNLVATPENAGAMGGWDVTVVQVGSTFDITNIVAEGTPNVPNSGATIVTLQFYSDTGGLVDSTDTLGATGDGLGGTNAPADNNWNSGSDGPNGFGGYSWVSPLTANNLLPNGSNAFALDSSTVVTGVDTSKSFAVEIQDGHQWSTLVTLITPEASSWLLLLAAIAPFGLLAMRRRLTNTG